MAAKLLLQQFLIHDSFDLHRDEYLHLDQAHHLAWGYASVPPATSWISWIIWQLGNSEFWVKFFPALFGALSIVLVIHTTRILGGALFAQILVAVTLFFSGLLRMNILYQPNSLDVLCWTALFFGCVQYIRTEKSKWLYFLCVSLAIGILNKYSIIFLALSLFPLLIILKRKTLVNNAHSYIATVLLVLLIAPNMYWQWQHDFPVLKHMQELRDTQLHLIRTNDFLTDQLYFFPGGLLVLLAAIISLITYPPFKPFRILLASFIITLLLFIYFKGKSYYVFGLYPIFFAFGATWLEKLLQPGWRKWLRYGLLLIPVLVFIPMWKKSFPNRNAETLVAYDLKAHGAPSHRWEDDKKYALSQDFADMLGWKELTTKTDLLISQIPDSAGLILLADNYGEAGAFNFYTKQKQIRAYSFNADYFLWMKEYLKKDTLPLTDIIWIQQADNNSGEQIYNYFGNVNIFDSISAKWAREKGTKIIHLSKARMDIRNFLLQQIKQRDGNEASN